MIIRLIVTIACLVLITFFAGFNLDNKCNINLLFKNFENVPVFFTIMISFVLGIICTLPSVIMAKFPKKKNKKDSKNPENSKINGFNKKSLIKNNKKENSTSSSNSSLQNNSDSKNVQKNQSDLKESSNKESNLLNSSKKDDLESKGKAN